MEDLKLRIKQLIVDSLELEDVKPENIVDSEPIFGAGLGLDSIDALELGVALKKEFGVKFSAESADNKKHFASVNALAAYIESETGGTVMTTDGVFEKLKEVLIQEFELEAGDISPEANLMTDLDLDSIDAVDLIVKMKPYLSGNIEPEMFKHVRTVQDVVEVLHPLVKLNW
jgi:acyl carrier protein